MLAVLLVLAGAAAALPVPVSPSTLIPAAGSQDRPVVASNGDSYFVVWIDHRHDIEAYGTRISRDGVVLDPTGIDLGPAFLVNVVWSGTNWLVVGLYGSIRTVAVDTDGHIVNTQENGTLFQTNRTFVASNGEWTVIVGMDYNYHPVVIVTDTLGTRNSMQILPAEVGSTSFAVASNGDGFLVTWSATVGFKAGVAEGVMLDRSGVISGSPLLLAGTYMTSMGVYSDGRDYLWAGVRPDATPVFRQVFANGTVGPSVAQPGASTLLAWIGDQYVSAGAAQFGTVSRDGVTFRRGSSIPTTQNHVPFDLALCAEGNRLLVVWSEGTSGTDSQHDVAAVLVDAHSTALLSLPAVISHSAPPQIATSLATNGERYIAAWQEQSIVKRLHDPDGVAYDSYVAAEGSDGAPSAPIRLNPDSDSMIQPHVVWNGSAYDVVAYQVDGLTPHLVASRVNAAGQLLDDSWQVLAETCTTGGFDVVSNGDVTLVAWGDCASGSILGIRLRNGQPIDPQPVVVSRHAIAGTSHELAPRLAWNGTAFVIVWDDLLSLYSHQAHAERLGTDLVPLEPVPILIGATSFSTDPAVASSGTESLITYTGARGYSMRVLSNAGQPLQERSVDDCYSYTQSISWSQGSYAIGCLGTRGFYGVRMTRDGVRLGRYDSPTNNRPASLALAPRGTGLLAFFTEASPGAPNGGVDRAWLQMLNAERPRALRH